MLEKGKGTVKTRGHNAISLELTKEEKKELGDEAPIELAYRRIKILLGKDEELKGEINKKLESVTYKNWSSYSHRGYRALDVYGLYKVCEKYGVSADYLLGLESTETRLGLSLEATKQLEKYKDGSDADRAILDLFNYLIVNLDRNVLIRFIRKMALYAYFNYHGIKEAWANNISMKEFLGNISVGAALFLDLQTALYADVLYDGEEIPIIKDRDNSCYEEEADIALFILNNEFRRIMDDYKNHVLDDKYAKKYEKEKGNKPPLFQAFVEVAKNKEDEAGEMVEDLREYGIGKFNRELPRRETPERDKLKVEMYKSVRENYRESEQLRKQLRKRT